MWSASAWTGSWDEVSMRSFVEWRSCTRFLVRAKFQSPEYAASDAGDALVLKPTESVRSEKVPFGPVFVLLGMWGLMSRNGSCLQVRELWRHEMVFINSRPFRLPNLPVALAELLQI
jgi:hypothetical protein